MPLDTFPPSAVYLPPTAYTPLWTSITTAPSLGNGTLTGRYVQFGKIVLVQIYFAAGSTTTFGSGDWRFSLPVLGRDSGDASSAGGGLVFGTDAGVNEYVGFARLIMISGSMDRFEILENGPNSGAVSGPINSTTRWGAGSPFTWGNGDYLKTQFTYEAA